MKLFAAIMGSEIGFEVFREGRELAAGNYRIVLDNSNGIIKAVVIDGVPMRCAIFQMDGTYYITVRGATFQVTVEDMRSEQIKQVRRASGAAGEQVIRAPISGIIKKVLVRGGESVRKGAPICTLVAMKMENEITCHVDGVINEVYVTENSTINKDSPIAKVTAE